MEENLPAPPLPPEVNLRALPYMPFYGDALLDSDFDAVSNDTEWRAGVTAWIKAWHQIPAASLPDDDAILARLLGFGRDVAGWVAVRPKALRGFVKCSDGRLYHMGLARIAMNSWESLGKAEDARRKARERMREKRSSFSEPATEPSPDVRRTSDVCSPNIPRTTCESSSKNAFNIREYNINTPPSLLRERPPPSCEERPIEREAIPPPDPKRPKRASRLPEDWLPSGELVEYARSKGLTDDDIQRELENFKDYWIAKSGASATKMDWGRVWQTWVRRAPDFQPKRVGPFPARRGPPTGEAIRGMVYNAVFPQGHDRDDDPIDARSDQPGSQPRALFG